MAADVPPGSPPADESVGNVLLILTGILMTFTALTTILRLWARWGRGAIGWASPCPLKHF